MATDGASWRQYRVIKRKVESETVTSIHLAADDGSALTPFKAGQFLTFRLRGSDGRHLARNYSISSDPGDPSSYRISVKREPSPAGRPDLPPGFGSTFMHVGAEMGAILEGSAPKGQFQLDQTSARPVLLLAGGIGITPLLAMAHALAGSLRPVWLIHACENGQVQPFATEIAELAARHHNLKALTCLREPSATDRALAHHQFEGLVTVDVLRAVLPIGNYDAYLCGPTGFMQAMFGLLLDLGVREEQIRHEFFGPATVLRASAAPLPVAVFETIAPPPHPSGINVTFSRSGLSAAWNGDFRTLLDFAEAQGLSPAFSCRNGICSTCLCEVDGEVTYIDEPLEEPGPGLALICCSVPKSALVVNI
ncbi:MAG: 2Fe-2S iron-sulfur cluster-binding protein [Bosea sp. (in: a-proteobacteria)]